MADQGEFIYDPDWKPERILASKPDLVLSVNEYHYDVIRCIEVARNARIPSLVIQDGILEWRCQYENPIFEAGGGLPQHEPVLSDKIACIGAQSARQIAAWGNAGKVEVTGMPRLDDMLQMKFSPIRNPGNRLLVMTAKKPWFDDHQKEVTLQSLIDLRNYLEQRPDINVTWRLTRNVASLIGVENRLNELSTQELSKTLDCVDAVVTTVSTTIIETMIANRPVAALDYHNVPRFVPTAWTITANEHISGVITDLLNPPQNKLEFQKGCFDDILYHVSPASELARNLIIGMVETGRIARELDKPLVFPDNIISRPTISNYHYLTEITDPITSEPKNVPSTDLQILRAKLSSAHSENQRLKENLRSYSIGYWLNLTGIWLIKKLKGKK